MMRKISLLALLLLAVSAFGQVSSVIPVGKAFYIQSAI